MYFKIALTQFYIYVCRHLILHHPIENIIREALYDGGRHQRRLLQKGIISFGGICCYMLLLGVFAPLKSVAV